MAATQGATSVYAKGRQTPSLQDKFQMTRRATVTQADVQPRIRTCRIVPTERGRGAHHCGKKLRDNPPVQFWIPQQCSRRNSGAETDYESGTRFTCMYDERQQRLQSHVAKRRHRIARIGDALNIKPPETASPR